MEDTIKTDLSSPESDLESETEIETPPSARELIQNLQYTVYVFELMLRRQQETNLCFIELKKRNPILKEKVINAEKAIKAVFQEILDEIEFLTLVLKESLDYPGTLDNDTKKGEIRDENLNQRPV